MNSQAMLIQQMDAFLNQFTQLNIAYQQHANNEAEMEQTIGQFTAFILDSGNRETWEQIEWEQDEKLAEKMAEKMAALREQSAYCVWAMEKYRAIQLEKNRNDIAHYFSNIESCIETEFGSFKITSGSKVLLIGAGAFPMTPLFIAQKTGATVVGIDIDSEAVRLAQMVVSILSPHFYISIKNCTIDQLEFTREATHIVISSTIKEKFDLLMQLHALTNPDVVVAMRYGNGMKSLFNYPLQHVDGSLWKIANNVRHPGNVFDVMVYKKVEKGG